ncbi:MAG: M14 family zinc carboxypeptidase [Oligoflexia bacterium]|nr:M14 family zinc carboxypeptidase [Oligoflexia bacterium]
MKITKFTIQSFIAALVVLSLGQVGFTTLAPEMPSTKIFRYKVQVPQTVDTVHLSKQLAAQGFDVAGVNLRKNIVEVITNDAGVEYIKTLGYQGNAFGAAPFDRAAGPDPRFLNPTTLAQKLKALNAAYPQFTRIEQIGTSIQGRPILAMLVSSTPQANDARSLAKPSIIFDGLHHAREIMTPEVVLDVAETLLKSAFVDNEARAKEIIAGWNVWVIPMLNLDGSNIVWSSNSMWRKNAHADQNRVFGVDLNRNYVYKWNACNGSSGSSWSETYRGATAGSEPETQALMKLAEAVRPTAYLSYHSYSELIIYPYGCRGQYSAEALLEDRVGKELAKRLPGDTGGNYAVGTPWQLLYDVDGDSMDHIHANYGSLAFTFEVNEDFHPPYSLREQTLVKHRAAWIYLLNVSDQNLLTVNVVDQKSNRPAAAAVVDVNTIVLSHGEMPFRTNAIGKFFKVLDPSTYVVTAKLPDGRSAKLQVQMSGRPQQVTISIP